MKRQALVEAICARFAEGGRPVGIDPAKLTLVSLHSGPWQRAQGAWSWCLYSAEAMSMGDFGGFEPATACAMPSAAGEDPESRVSAGSRSAFSAVTLSPPERWSPKTRKI